MATYKLLKDLILGETNAPIKVRISREWEGRRAGSTHVTNKTYILLDEEGTQIQASPLPYTLIPDFTKRLKAGHIYMISDYNVVRAAKTYKSVPGEYAINFNRKTTDQKLDDIPAIPMYIFQITSFQQARGRIDDVITLMDVVGNLQEATEIQTSKAGKKYIDIVIADERHDKIKITLWENQAYAFLKFEHEYKKPNVILIVTGTTSRTVQGEPVLWSSSSTQYFFNIDHPAIAALRQNPNMKDNLTPSIVPFVKSKNQNTTEENIEKISIEKLHNTKLPPGTNAIKFITEAIVSGIIPHNGWYYMACNKCNRKLNELQECSVHNSTTPVPKYRVIAQVNDSTSDTTFVLFDRHVMKLINVSAQHILYNDKNASPETIPAILNNILGRRYRFNFSLTSYNIDANKEDYTVNDVEEITDQERITASSEPINKSRQLDDDNGKDLNTVENKRKLLEEENNIADDSDENVAALDPTNKGIINKEHDAQPTSGVTNKVGKHNHNKRQK